MNNKYFGKSQLSNIGLGTSFSNYDPANDKKYINLIQEAVDIGINVFDTAEIYLQGKSEFLLGKALVGKRDKVFISTKISPEHCAYDLVIKSCNQSLKRLKTNYIDLYQVHWPNPIVPIEETMAAFEELVKQGKVRSIGVSNFSLRQLKDAQAALKKNKIVSLQTEYNLAERSIEQDFLTYCQKQNITIMAYTPLISGRAIKDQSYNHKLQKIAKRYNKTISQIVLNWLISHKNVMAIPCTSNRDHLLENSKANTFSLKKEDIDAISNNFKTKIFFIDPKKIQIAPPNDHHSYKTLSQALENKLNFFPSPEMLSDNIRKGDFLKPIKLRLAKDHESQYKYELAGGRIRYWAWIITFGENKKIPAIIE